MSVNRPSLAQVAVSPNSIVVRVNQESYIKVPCKMHLEYRQPPVGLGPQYISSTSTTLRMTHSLGLSKEELRVTDPIGNTVFIVKLSDGLHKRKEMNDASGQIIFPTSTKMMSSSGTTTGSFVTGQEAFKVIKEDIGGRTGARATFVDPVNGPQSVLIGSRRNIKSEATVEDDRGVLAVLKWNDLEMGLGSRKTGDGSGTDYDITIAPGVDIALVVILCACYDSLRVEKVAQFIGDVLGGV